ncbi:hypothetical protein ACFWMJ_40115 [Streptomyces hawaiiensis]|uniref:hypothetical protein n=1 Tax=Streptomyces hawaiiensis TaxID=67305 RepID=UPI003650B8F3
MAEQPVEAGGDAPGRPRTYDEIITGAWFSEEERQQAKADSPLGHMAALLFQRGDTRHVQLLLLIREAVIEYDQEGQDWDLWLEIDPANYAVFTDEVKSQLRDAFRPVARRLDYGVDNLLFRETMPRVGPDWRERLEEMLSGERPTNQARRTMPEKPQRIQDSLAFTNAGEQRVYRALKYLQEKELPSEETISIFPLPNGRGPGHTWEPDLLVTYRGRAGVLEIDGPNHRVRRAMDTSRDHLLRDAGIAYVDRIAVEVIDDA